MPTFDTGISWAAPAAVALLVLGAAITVGTERELGRTAAALGATAVAAAATVLDGVVLAAAVRGPVVVWVGGWAPSGGRSPGIVLEADPMGATLAVVAGALATTAALYSYRYAPGVDGKYYALLLLFLAGMTGFAFTADLFDLFVFFELMGAAAYALTGMRVEDPTAVQGALNFGVVNSLGAYLSLFGVGLVYARTGQLGLPQLRQALDHQHRLDALVVVGFVLVVTGFLVKAAAVPFHFWLADAHAVAPAPVCTLFSGIMVPLGVYATFRVWWVVFSGVVPAGDVRRALIVLGVLTAVVGTVMCVGQHHVKRLLAYSTIGHVGLFVCALALMTPAGTAGALLYLLGHAGAKGALFLLAGIMLERYGSVDERRLFGRGRRARIVPWLWVAGALALAGLPPFGTALGKSVSESAAAQAGLGWLVALFVVVSGVTGGAVLRVTGRVYFGLGRRPEVEGDSGPESEDEQGEDRLARVPVTMLVPVLVLLGGCLAEGLYPAAHAAAEHAGAVFADPAGLARTALDRAPLVTGAGRPGNWTVSGSVLGLASVAVAGAVAAAAFWGGALAERLETVLGPVRRAFAALRRLHSGHIGDYVAWLFTGVAALVALVGLPLLGSR